MGASKLLTILTCWAQKCGLRQRPNCRPGPCDWQIGSRPPRGGCQRQSRPLMQRHRTRPHPQRQRPVLRWLGRFSDCGRRDATEGLHRRLGAQFDDPVSGKVVAGVAKKGGVKRHHVIDAFCIDEDAPQTCLHVFSSGRFGVWQQLIALPSAHEKGAHAKRAPPIEMPFVQLS